MPGEIRHIQYLRKLCLYLLRGGFGKCASLPQPEAEAQLKKPATLLEMRNKNRDLRNETKKHWRRALPSTFFRVATPSGA